MGKQSFTIQGRQQDVGDPIQGSQGIQITPVRRIIPGTTRDGASSEHEVKADQVVRVELENGFVLWGRVDDLIREHGNKSVTRDGSDTWELPSLKPGLAVSQAGERGLFGLAIKVLDFFGVNVHEEVARNLGRVFEDRQFRDNPEGLCRCSLDSPFALEKLADSSTVPADEGPLLVFLHGTASSCEGSFGKLWAPENTAGSTARKRLRERYGERVFALEHRTLSESPITNAFALAERLPAGAELHLVSHSRGGLVGELLCLGQCENLAQQLTAERLKQLFAADRTIAEQLDLSPLDVDELQARDAAYEADRKALARLVKVLVAKNFRITRFVRTACPARGTTLASGRLDRWLSMLDFLAGKALGESLFADAMDFLLAVVKARTDPRTLPGLEAMMPGSALTRLLHRPDLVTRSDLSVIAGDIEGDSLWQRLKLLAGDWFYGADHDLVVNTGSMSGGLRRPDNGARALADKGSEVNHFAYFRNERSVNWLLLGLTRRDHEDGGFQPIGSAQHEEPRWRSAVARSQTDTRPRPLAVVLPGILGSHLKAAGKHVWLNYWALNRGGLEDIAMGAPDIAPDMLIDDFYGPLLEHLAQTHRVRVFAYDWRLSIRQAAAKLAEAMESWLLHAERDNQPVHLVAHSMGGLVARAMIADGGPGAAIWQRITRLPHSRLLMLGTPNLGSYEAVRWLTGYNPTQGKLSLLDFTRTTSDVVSLACRFPGLLELLPCAPGDVDFANPAIWRDLRQGLGAHWGTASAEDLEQARDTWKLLRSSVPDPKRMCYVAGCQPATVIGYQFGTDWLGRKRLDFRATREGDGTVPWASGLLPQVPAWYLEDTAHDALCIQHRAFPAYLDLLQRGTTTRLPTTPPLRSRAAGDEAKTFILPSIPPTDGIPAESDVHDFGFGGGVPDATPADGPILPMINISIRHGDLTYARYPVLVGHYRGDSIISAERALDRQLGGVLSQRLALGLYPSEPGSHALFFNDRARTRPSGAIVIGLGQLGELGPVQLETGVRTALLDYALQRSQENSKADGPRHTSLSCLLVGTRAGGLTIRDSLEAMLRGIIAANAKLLEIRLENPATLNHLEILEVYEDKAITAAEALRELLDNSEFADTVSWSTHEVESGHGGQRRLLLDEGREWWQRLEIIEEKGPSNALRFIFTTDRARAEETLATGQLALADAFIRQASGSSSTNRDTARTLFEMLLPLRLRESAPRQQDLVLLVDEHSARYPWELLENRWGGSRLPPAVRAGLIRQLKTSVFRAQPAQNHQNRILVVGNPELKGWNSFADLPGARMEAQCVIEQFKGQGWQVHDCIDQHPEAILQSLHQDNWRILHLAGHGVHEYEPEHSGPGAKPISGMVIGPRTFLIPGDIEQMRWVPELVFINCCHLGQTQSRQSNIHGELAANLGVQFIRMGVRAVIAAGWAVDDAAALAFAKTFYRKMLAGMTFGEAVHIARKDIWERFPGVNTWGAYQCYGDPGYRLCHACHSPVLQSRSYSSPAELTTDLNNLTQLLEAPPGFERDENAAQRIDALIKRIPEPQEKRWPQCAEVAAALGLAWGAAHCWKEAIECLERALTAAAGDCPIRILEKLAEFRSRAALDRWRALQRQAAPQGDPSIKEHMEQAINDLELLCQRAPTSKRLSLLGDAYKRHGLVNGTPWSTTLEQMAGAYLKSFQRDECCSLTSFNSWTCAQWLALRLGAQEPVNWGTTFQTDSARLRDAWRNGNRTLYGIEEATAIANLDLICLLAAVPAGATNLAAFNATIAEIMQGYRTALAFVGGTTQRATMTEHLEWLMLVLRTSDPALTATLQQIRDEIR